MLDRPFKVPMYPVFPLVALSISIFSFSAMAIYNLKLVLFYFLLLGICYGSFRLFKRNETFNQ
jgi:ethanolamine permease